jgi:hypothetical protein
MIAHRRVDALQNRVRKNPTAHHHAAVHPGIQCHKTCSVFSRGIYVP